MGPPRIVVVRGFVRWFKCSGKILVNARTPKEASQGTASVQFLRAVVECVCIMGTVHLVEFRLAINLQRRKQITEKLTMGTGL
ncbi:hypothetical protein AVEN_118806-1 [Araneus ventricosus]|uniref:Uncharacterized protein n=1 Tax=Araneus ventricosus TaxID=182803 RepID=A0A4Y2BWY4_ARAVE|nr:hypothetical protein AVEN_118806-1 [Araneus ventricosus]